jgi:glycerol-3-phosphate dehydrogenase (NAD(P)+)
MNATAKSSDVSSSRFVSVIGAGAMGAALAINFDRSGNKVALCATEFDDAVVEAIAKTGAHPSIGQAIPGSIRIVGRDDWASALERTDILVLAVASTGIRRIASEVAPTLPKDATILVATKGWDSETVEPLHKILEQEIPSHAIVLFVGPTLAGEFATGRPTAAVCASESLEAAEDVAKALRSPALRVFITDDVVGVEVGAALKNVVAVAIGMCEGLAEASPVPFTNAKAALFAQALTEMTRLGRALGGRDETVMGLAGAGDLFVTVAGGRNGRFGRLIGKGVEPEAALAQMNTTVEGFEGTARAVALAERLGLDLPLVRMVHSVLYEGVEPSKALESFFASWTEPD